VTGFFDGVAFVTVTEQAIVEAQLKTGRQAMEFLESIAALGERLSIAAQNPFDLEKDEHITLQMKTVQFGALMQMFHEVSEYVKGIVSFDSIEQANEFVEAKMETPIDS
jgi:hypothetical protein